MAERDQFSNEAAAAATAAPALHEEAELAFVAMSRARLAMVVTDPRRADNPIVLANDSFLELTGYARDEVIGRNCRFLQGPATDAAAVAAIRDAVAAARDVEVELLNYRKDGSHFWNELAISAIRDAAGNVINFFASQKNVTSRHELQAARAALSESEARFRALIDSSAQMVWVTGPGGEAIEDSPSWRAFTGQTADERAGFGWLDAIHPDDRDAARRRWDAAITDEAPLDGEFRLRHAPSGGWRWTEQRATPLRRPDGSLLGWVGMNTDIEARKRAADEQRTLMKEVDHRAKNALAIVQGIVRLTRAGSVEAYAEAVQRRVEALALAHSLLSARRWGKVPLTELARCALAAERGARVACDGPALNLPPHLVQPIALLLHELLDNARRHGALASPGGSVALGWRRAPGRKLALRWEETGGALVAAQPVPGFGMTMMRSIVERQLRGALGEQWARTGLVVDIELPLAK